MIFGRYKLHREQVTLCQFYPNEKSVSRQWVPCLSSLMIQGNRSICKESRVVLRIQKIQRIILAKTGSHSPQKHCTASIILYNK